MPKRIWLTLERLIKGRLQLHNHGFTGIFAAMLVSNVWLLCCLCTVAFTERISCLDTNWGGAGKGLTDVTINGTGGPLSVRKERKVTSQPFAVVPKTRAEPVDGKVHGWWLYLLVRYSPVAADCGNRTGVGSVRPTTALVLRWILKMDHLIFASVMKEYSLVQ